MVVVALMNYFSRLSPSIVTELICFTFSWYIFAFLSGNVELKKREMNYPERTAAMERTIRGDSN